jgi:hypothetical protein
VTLLLGALAGAAGRADATPPTDTGQASESSSLTVFPSELSVSVQRGGQVDEPIGVVQTGAAERTVRFEVTGEAARFVTLVSETDGSAIESLTAFESQPAYAIVRVAPGLDVEDGTVQARIRIVADDEDVSLGSELSVDVEVSGEQDLRATLLGAAVVSDPVELGRPLRVRLDVDVQGTTPIEPVVTLDLSDPDGVVTELEARPAPPEPEARSTLETAWPTQGWSIGRHTGEIVLASGSAEIGRAPISVEIVAAGTLEPSVTLLRAELASEARPHEIAKVLVTVRNDGDVDGRAVFAGDLLYETEVLSAVRSDPLLIAPGETGDLAVYAELGGPGAYQIRGRAVMEGAESGTVAVDFVAEASSTLRWIAIAGGVGAALLLLAALLIRRRR